MKLNIIIKKISKTKPKTQSLMKYLLFIALIALTMAQQKEIQQMENDFAFHYNSGDFEAVAKVYNPGALLIPPTGDAFIP